MLLARWFVFLCVLLPTLRAGDVGLVRVGETWRYFKGVAEPPRISERRWIEPEYDDRTWPASPSGFSTPTGYGEPTILNDYGYGYQTLYFRRQFTVRDPGNVAQVVLRIDYDDGFVAYLNGQEVARRGVAGLPNQPVAASATALYHARGVTEHLLLTNATPLLRAGTNLLAIQLIGSGTFDSSFCFVPELLANVIRGPFVQNTTESSTQVIWKTFGRAASAIEYGTNLNHIERLEVAPAEMEHVATLNALAADTEYLYRVINRFGANETYSDWSTFRTFKRTGPVTFQVVGDSGWASAAQFAIAEQMERSPADFLMHVGDLVYYAITHHNSDLRCFSVYHEQMRRRPWFVAVGNHEMYVDREAALQSFYLPTNSVTGTEHYYSFDHGDVHFVVAWSDMAAGSRYEPGSPQYEWLDADLARSTKPWKFLFFHHTWRTSAVHRGDDYDRNQVLDSEQLDVGLAGLARKHGIQIIFNGHDHCYERLAPSGGPISFISGGGGAAIYPMATPHPDSSQFYPRHHFLSVTVEGEEACVEAVGTDGNVFDKVHVRRSFPERRVHNAAWNTPLIESGPPTDAHGNTSGQQFDLTGAPMIGPMGLFSSAGRLFVNNDGTNIYFGFDEVMLRGGEELFLFIEVPSVAGQTSLDESGNGLVDPTGEGADGLDFLGNLRFENFSPAIGVVLGDEWGDAHDRSFTRSGQVISTGQGAFYLTNGLPSVPGQRLVQFNRSPQDFSAPYEQNADYVELSIPFSVLGALKPGDLIRVGAITALRAMDTNIQAQTRQIDSGGIGSSIRRVEGITVLEGSEVKLASAPDSDFDGLNDNDEVLQGTDPTQPDSDNDGLLDGWEVSHGFKPLTKDSSNDADADGFSNLSEFRAGTHPKDATSRLELHPIQINGHSLRLLWRTVPGKRYKLQYRDSLAEPFRDLDDPSFPRRAQGTSDSFLLDFSADLRSGSRYYRVQLVE